MVGARPPGLSLLHQNRDLSNLRLKTPARLHIWAHCRQTSCRTEDVDSTTGRESTCDARSALMWSAMNPNNVRHRADQTAACLPTTHHWHRFALGDAANTGYLYGKFITATARFRIRVKSCWICVGQTETAAGSLRVLRFRLPINHTFHFAPQSSVF
jgi:hypothetical protein